MLSRTFKTEQRKSFISHKHSAFLMLSGQNQTLPTSSGFALPPNENLGFHLERKNEPVNVQLSQLRWESGMEQVCSDEVKPSAD